MRVFIHSTSGQVTEQNLTTPSPEEPETEENSGGVVLPSEEEGCGDPSHPHNHTNSKSVLMDLTLEPSSTTLDPTSKYEEEPYVEQVRIMCIVQWTLLTHYLRLFGDHLTLITYLCLPPVRRLFRMS